MPCDIKFDDKTVLTVAGALQGLHAVGFAAAPRKFSENFHTGTGGNADLDAMTRFAATAQLAGAAAALALGREDDMGKARRLALTGQGLAMVGVAVNTAREVRKERVKKEIGWTATALHAGMGAVCLVRGLKEGFNK
jgi:hypothetical protein